MIKSLVVVVVVGSIAVWAYNAGKSTGSRKGFGVGRNRGRRRRR